MVGMVCTCNDELDCPALLTVHECLPWCDYLKEVNNGTEKNLIELLKQDTELFFDKMGSDDYENLADHLLANGVVVLPCKVGDTVYDIYESFYNGGSDVRALKVTDIHIHLDKLNKAWIIIGGYYFTIDDFGKTVFFTKEEAERALEKRKGGDE